MEPSIVLVAGPLVGASSLVPTADRLSALGARVQLPDVLSAASGVPAWSTWSSHLENLISVDEETILVGHSAASVFVADLASRLPVRGLLIVDGLIPPADGPVGPATTPIREMLNGIVDNDGLLPLWSDWWGTEPRASAIGITALARNPHQFAEFKRNLPRMRLSWFDDAIDLAPWRHVRAGYVQTSSLYARSGDEAERLGWPLVRLDGTHLHPTLQPDETASTILAICKRLTSDT